MFHIFLFSVMIMVYVILKRGAYIYFIFTGYSSYGIITLSVCAYMYMYVYIHYIYQYMYVYIYIYAYVYYVYMNMSVHVVLCYVSILYVFYCTFV